MPAQAVFCCFVMGMQVDELWKGRSGLGHGAPVTWVVGPPNSGKTEAALLGHAMIGNYHTAAFGGDATKPLLNDKVSQKSCLTLFIDDVTVKKNLVSPAHTVVVRGLYDRTTRAVSGKLRTPHSTVLFSSNYLINRNDAAFKTRLLEIIFAETKPSDGVAEDPNLLGEWIMQRELFSSLAVDFASLLVDGELDQCSIQDCSRFLQAAVGRKRDRNVNM